MLLFAQESLYWLTGYDTFGFCFFQCLYFAADGRVALLTRSADLRQAQRTSNISDIRVWKDADDANPARDLAVMLGNLGARGRLGVENDSYGLTHFNGRRLEAALDGVATLVEASRLVAYLRVTKSDEEIALCSRSGEAFRLRRSRRDRADHRGGG
jgi:Xaa-Pro dipeptidase